MDESFNPKQYLDHVASELIANFAHAGQATTPLLVGGAREHEVRRKLGTLLPPIVSVGSGCVIDSYGNTSKQIDIVVYEKDICPVFSINNTPETTYYPCEGVIAVGEVKSSLDSQGLLDSYKKIDSIKRLTRYAQTSNGLAGPSVPFRHYGNLTTLRGTPEEGFDQTTKEFDQIFGFVLAGDLGVSTAMLCDRAASNFKAFSPHTVPNLFVILNHGLMMYFDPDGASLSTTPLSGSKSMFITSKRDNNFQFLLGRLYKFARNGRTPGVKAFERYMFGDSEMTIQLDGEFSLFPTDAQHK